MMSVVLPSALPTMRIWFDPMALTSATDGSPSAIREMFPTLMIFCVPTPSAMVLASSACAVVATSTTARAANRDHPRYPCHHDHLDDVDKRVKLQPLPVNPPSPDPSSPAQMGCVISQITAQTVPNAMATQSRA